MTSTTEARLFSGDQAALAVAVDDACGRIAPAWPLDRMIAVNPYGGFVDRPMQLAGAELNALSGTRILMPRAWYRAQWRAGRFDETHIAQALQEAGGHGTAAEVVAILERERDAPGRRRLLSDLADERRDLAREPGWEEFITRQISQAVAAYFDAGQARWTPDREGGLYQWWRQLALADHSPRLLMGLRGFRSAVAALPPTPDAAISAAVDTFHLHPARRAAWFTALLLRVHGWASHCAFRRWEARLAGGDDDQIVHLLAIRLAWELILHRAGDAGIPGVRWNTVRPEWEEPLAGPDPETRGEWLLQRAMELGYREQLLHALRRPPESASPAPAVQAVFCIDVRSEVFRRALETVEPSVATLGFAGFFGLPIAYSSPVGTPRPQLPGLLAPALVVRDTGPGREELETDQRSRRQAGAAWHGLWTTPTSAFPLVEVAGLSYAVELLRETLGLGGPAGDPLRAEASGRSGIRPELAGTVTGEPLPLGARVDLAANVLRAMSLTHDFARVVALIGHGAGVRNNPQAAGLHCGACGGQTGEVNARALAALLNDQAVRSGLAERGIVLPATTHVIAGLHNTTTDDITLYDLQLVPGSHQSDVEALRRWLELAARRARTERASALGITSRDETALTQTIRRRAANWSEVRPEWGLAGNASFVIAPRARTRGLDLHGRSFLHEYRWEEDEGFRVLEQIMTAPMVVTHWINMQYWASTVDNLRYGSGNKLLHNVVGGCLGVFEGAGGDLRAGLALQSLHDGLDWVHHPLRLSVVIEAPHRPIDDILARHDRIRQLVSNEWLHLYRIAPENGSTWQWGASGWRMIQGAVAGARGPGDVIRG